ncbi:hypothetical protein LTR17_023021, partial [Elasticomyces elasticus]
QHFSLYQGKWLISNSMEELIDRNAALMYHASLIPPQQPPPGAHTPAHLARLDSHILCLDDEAAWRAHQLAAHTIPTDLEVQARNVGRNGAW